MALKSLSEYLSLVPDVSWPLNGESWSSFDEEADVLYIHFRKSGPATDSELTDDDIILRYDGDELIGITILHASQR